MDWARATKVGLGVGAGFVAIGLALDGDPWLALLAAAGCFWLLTSESPHPPEPMSDEYRGGGRGKAGPYARRHLGDGSAGDGFSQGDTFGKNVLPRDARAQRSRALAILSVGQNPSTSEILEAHRRLMKMRHPDLGGTHASAAELNWARDLLLRS